MTDSTIQISGSNNQVFQGVQVGRDLVLGDKVGDDKVAGDKVAGDKVAGDKVAGDKITTLSPSTSSRPLKPGPWRVFLSHTSELRQYPQAGPYIDRAERAVSGAGHAIVDMADFPAIDQTPAAVCEQRVRECDVLVGIYGLRYGSPVRDQPEVSYTELEFLTATHAGLPRLIFVINAESEQLGLPPKALVDREHGHRQDAFLQRVKDAGLTLQVFRNPDDLKGLVERSLRELAESATAPAAAVPPSRSVMA